MYRFKISKPLGNVGHKYIMREIQGSLDCFDGQMGGGREWARIGKKGVWEGESSGERGRTNVKTTQI